jgi:hypothetical protein
VSTVVSIVVSMGAVQKAIARAEGRSTEPTPKPNAPPGSTRAQESRATRPLDIRERLEHEALHARDSRTRLNALKMLQDLDAKPDTEGTSGPPLYARSTRSRSSE